MRISVRRAVLASVGVVALTAGAIPAGAAPRPSVVVSGGVTQPVFSYGNAIREYVRVRSSVDADGDGRKDLIWVDIIRPRETASGLKVPVIMDESPYYDTLGRGHEAEKKTYDAAGNPVKFPLFYDNYFVPRGYAVLNVDMDGTTKSDGCPTSGGASDVLGGKAIIDWLNGRGTAYDAHGRQVAATWTTGRTAMIGKSYDGTLAEAVAATGVPGLVTIVPISSWYDYNRVNGVLWSKGMEDQLAARIDSDPPAKCAAVRQRLLTGEDDATGDYNPVGSSTAGDDACYKQVATVTADVNVVARGYLDAQNRLSLSHPSPLVPGRATAVRWNLLPQDYRFKAGHRLALIIFGTDADLQDDDATGAAVTVDLAGSRITLPVVASGTPTMFAPERAWNGPAHVVLPEQPRDFR